MSDVTVTIIVAVLSSGVLSTLINCLFNLVSASSKKETGIEKGLRQILYYGIKQKCKSYISRGYITNEELQDLIAEHDIYHMDLNGNGYLDAIMAKTKSLPIKVESPDPEVKDLIQSV